MTLKQCLEHLFAAALAYPEAREDHPWGERVVKVKGKIFAFFGVPSDRLTVTVKLPKSGLAALALPGCEPTGYNLGKSGWVTARFDPQDDPPLPLILEWVDESYRAVAPTKLVAQLDLARAGGSPARDEPGAETPRKPAARKPAAPKPAARKPAARKPAARKPAARQPAAKRTRRAKKPRR